MAQPLHHIARFTTAQPTPSYCNQTGIPFRVLNPNQPGIVDLEDTGWRIVQGNISGLSAFKQAELCPYCFEAWRQDRPADYQGLREKWAT